MKLIDSLAADYWIENTDEIYKADLHVSSPIMDAYRAGFIKAKQLARDRTRYRRYSIVLKDDSKTVGYVEACSDLMVDMENLGEQES